MPERDIKQETKVLNKRIIPCLDINKGRVVKGVNFVNLIDAGDPVEVAKAYNAMRADEIVFLDITASHEGRATIYDVISRAAEQVFIPLTVGGGISTVEHFRKLLNLGADKISVNSAAIKNPDLITDAALKFGRQCVVVAIDAKRNDKGSFDVYLNGGRINTGKDAIEWAVEAEKRGAGEILVSGGQYSRNRKRRSRREKTLQRSAGRQRRSGCRACGVAFPLQGIGNKRP